MTTEEIERIKRLLALVDDEPQWVAFNGWLAEQVDDCTCDPHQGHHHPECGSVPIVNLGESRKDVNAAVFIANARGALHTLLDEVERLRGPQPPFRPNWHEATDDGRDKKPQHDRTDPACSQNRMLLDRDAHFKAAIWDGVTLCPVCRGVR